MPKMRVRTWKRFNPPALNVQDAQAGKKVKWRGGRRYNPPAGPAFSQFSEMPNHVASSNAGIVTVWTGGRLAKAAGALTGTTGTCIAD